MGFQVSIITLRHQISSLTSISVPTSFVALCQPFIYLDAIIQGDLTGHTIEWEQLTGSAANWIGSRFALSVTYSQTIRDDKSFRFWVDRGTRLERYRDVIVYGTPTDEPTMGIGCSEFPQYKPWVSSEEPTNFLLLSGPVTFNDVPYEFGFLPEAFSWTSSYAGRTLVLSTVEVNTTGQYQVVTTIPAGGQLIHYGISSPAVYRINSTYNTNGVLTTVTSYNYRPANREYRFISNLDKYDTDFGTPYEHYRSVSITSRQLKSFGISNPEIVDTPDYDFGTPYEHYRSVSITSRQLKSFGISNPEIVDTPTAAFGTPYGWGFTINIIERQNSTVGG